MTQTKKLFAATTPEDREMLWRFASKIESEASGGDVGDGGGGSTEISVRWPRQDLNELLRALRRAGDPAAGDLGEVTFMLGCEIRRATKCQSTLAATLSMQIMQRWGAKLFGSPPRLPAIGQLEERISWATTIFREQA